jgi:hypothetical protein
MTALQVPAIWARRKIPRLHPATQELFVVEDATPLLALRHPRQHNLAIGVE